MKRRDFFKGAAAASAGLILFPKEAMSANVNRINKSCTHKIMTSNIRVALPTDIEKGLGWDARKELTARVIKKHNPDIICMQEVIKVQMDDMRDFFPEFASFGFEGPEMDPFPEGYHWIAKNPIMFSRERYELLTGGCFWLSDKPLIGGTKSWGTARARNVVWVRVLDKQSGKEFRVINLHLDHISQEAREVQIEMILDESAQYIDNFPQVLVGDFNTGADNKVLELVRERGWKDSYRAIHGSVDPGFTYHAFKGDKYKGKTEESQKNSRIDFILLRGNVQATSANIIRDNDNGFYPSDHYFVSSELKI